MKLKRNPGKSLFVTFEGIDGCGKSTQLKLAAKYLKKLGYNVVILREPGSTPTAEKIRKILLDKRSNIADITELLLYEAARSEITYHEIAPKLSAGTIVLCDRFYDSTTAYQGYGRGLDIGGIKRLHKLAVSGCHPDLTLLFDLDIHTASSRLSKSKDRLENQSKAFFRRVRNGFLEIASKEKGRVKVIDASRTVEEIFEDVKVHLNRKLKTR